MSVSVSSPPNPNIPTLAVSTRSRRRPLRSMTVATVSAPTRPVSPARVTNPQRRCSPLNPSSRPRPSIKPPTTSTVIPAATTTTSTRTHLSNLDRLLQKQAASQPPKPPIDYSSPPSPRSHSSLNLLNALDLLTPFHSHDRANEDMSPRSLAHLQRLLSDSPRPSPKSSIADRWRDYHGANNWEGLLDPLDENLRRELVRCGDFVHAAYHTFHTNPSASHRQVMLPDRSYRVLRNLHATSSIDATGLPTDLLSRVGFPSWMTSQRSSWLGFAAVCDLDQEVRRMGRRDLVIALRGTATCHEWAEDFRANLVPVDDNNDADDASDHIPKVSSGFKSLLHTPGDNNPSLATIITDGVRCFMETYKGEELSITVTGHSLGAALAVLVADEVRAKIPDAPPIAVYTFGGPRVGNKAFAERVEKSGVRVLRVANAHDVITKVPMGWRPSGYADVGRELRLDSRASPFLKPNAGPGCCHDLEAYLHLVDGFLGTGCPFRADAKRSIARLLDQQMPSVKPVYVNRARARALGLGPIDVPAAQPASNVPGCLASPSLR